MDYKSRTAAARGFLSQKSGGNVTTEKTHIRIAAFLAWPAERVKQALSQLNAIESGELSKKAVEILPTIHAVSELRGEP